MILLNRATYLPPDMHFMTFRHECLFSVAGDPPRPWSPHVCKLLVQHFAQRQWTQQLQRDPLRKPNCTEAWLSTEGAYREVLGSVLHQQKFDTQLKHTVQPSHICSLLKGPAGLAVKPLDLHMVNVGSIPTGPTHGEV